MVTSRDREQAAELLDCSAHISQIEFYCYKSELPESASNQPELRCRISSMRPMTKGQVEALATQLNSAIDPIKEALSHDILIEARNKIGGMYADPVHDYESMSYCTHRQSEWSFLDWDDASLMRAACHEKGCRNYAEDGYRYCITHLHGTPDAMPEQMWTRKLFLEKGDNHD